MSDITCPPGKKPLSLVFGRTSSLYLILFSTFAVLLSPVTSLCCGWEVARAGARCGRRVGAGASSTPAAGLCRQRRERAGRTVTPGTTDSTALSSHKNGQLYLVSQSDMSFCFTTPCHLGYCLEPLSHCKILQGVGVGGCGGAGCGQLLPLLPGDGLQRGLGPDLLLPCAQSHWQGNTGTIVDDNCLEVWIYSKTYNFSHWQNGGSGLCSGTPSRPPAPIECRALKRSSSRTTTRIR